ncbi:hypothetical protein AOQ84DRAFT_437589 [Glonium stellatum]|uniref:Uncharacterized protein n=1 Tax=Glonium stellatum TaxID=574774 RepID=A0A8E2F7L5_9PEZI|nr:hypothetical protein AOQ84DRAFT_437589 [Glonium stellatum]
MTSRPSGLIDWTLVAFVSAYGLESHTLSHKALSHSRTPALTSVASRKPSSPPPTSRIGGMQGEDLSNGPAVLVSVTDSANPQTAVGGCSPQSPIPRDADRSPGWSLCPSLLPRFSLASPSPLPRFGKLCG